MGKELVPIGTILKNFYESDKYQKEDWYWTRNPGGIQGDFIYNNCGKIVYDKDVSNWAIENRVRCGILLYDHKRWPDKQNDDTVVKTWFARIVNRIINKLFGTHLPFRYQGRMVRDSYTAYYAACILHKRHRFIEVVKPPWYVWTPAFYSWRKFLITKEQRYLDWYYVFERPSRKDWKRKLEWLRDISIYMILTDNDIF